MNGQPLWQTETVRGKVRFYELRLFKSERAHKNRISRRTPFFLRRSSGIYDNSFSWKGWKCWWTQFSVCVYGKRKIPDQITYNEHLKNIFFSFKIQSEKSFISYSQIWTDDSSFRLVGGGLPAGMRKRGSGSGGSGIESTASASLVSGIVFEGTSFSLFSWKMTLFLRSGTSHFGFLVSDSLMTRKMMFKRTVWDADDVIVC